MPQLDFLIILPQIFWLILFFSLTYFSLTYFFLPLFLKTLNSRKYFLKINKNKETSLINDIINNRSLVFKNLSSNFDQLKSILFFRLLHLKFQFYKKPYSHQFSKLNNKIFKATVNSILYCNFTVLQKIKIYPRILKR